MSEQLLIMIYNIIAWPWSLRWRKMLFSVVFIFNFFVCLFDCFSYFYFVFLLCMRGVYFSNKFNDCSVFDPTEIIIKTVCSFLRMSYSLLSYIPYSCFSHIFLVKFNSISYRDKALDGIDSKLKAIVKLGSGSTWTAPCSHCLARIQGKTKIITWE
jgi:hypothetical protein